ncbi:MAG: hypothetical protein AAFN92_00660 [Bacteroidota bacterium]
MSKPLLIIAILCLPYGLRAHQPDISSTMLVEQTEEIWLLQVRGALTAFEYLVQDHYGASTYATPEEFRQLVDEYLRSRISIEFGGGEMATLADGAVKLGHETMVTYRLDASLSDAASLVVTNTSFRPIRHNQNVLYFVRAGAAREQFILSDDNDQRVKLEASEGKFVLAAPSSGWVGFLPYFMSFGLALAVAMGYSSSRR